MADPAWRLFLALEPPETIRREIRRIQTLLKAILVKDIRWISPEACHLTLKFFGDVPTGGVAALADTLRPLAAATPAIALEVRGIGVFPDLRRPRVLWAGMTGDVGRLAVFQREIELSLAAIGYPPEERPFQAHLTLGRIRSLRGLSGLDRALAAGREVSAGAFRVGEILLFRSELTPRGPRYTALDKFPLREIPGT